MNILISGVGGKTGNSIIRLLLGKNHNLSVYLHRQETITEIRMLADVTAFVGDLSDNDRLKQSLVGIDAVYLIVPNMNPIESLIGENMINLCKQMGVSRIIYHSVLHPQALAMPHHRQKLLVEEKLFESWLWITPFFNPQLICRIFLATGIQYEVVLTLCLILFQLCCH